MAVTTKKTQATHGPPLVMRLPVITDEHKALVGGKAFSLAALARAGLPVPDAFALTTEALRLFIGQSALRDDLQRIEDEVRGGRLSLKESWEFLGQTRARIVEAPLPREVEAALVGAYHSVHGSSLPVAVRSSGTKEDMEAASFAGQYETFLNVTGEEALKDAVKRCWASIWRNRVLHYANRRAGGAEDLGMSVIVQQMIDADISGVLFTVNPLTGKEREMLVEAVWGLGEALVSGHVNADRYIVDVHTGKLRHREIAKKKKKVVSLPEGETQVGATGGTVYTGEVDLTDSVAGRPTLDMERLHELVGHGGAIQEHFGCPVDVEWVVRRGGLYFLQARPITTITFASDLGEWTTADFKDGGVSSDVCAPYMWSLYELCLETSMPGYFKDIGLLEKDYEAKWSQMFFGRGYWNLGEVKKVLAKIPGYDEKNFDQDLGVEAMYDGDSERTPVTITGILKALPIARKLKKHYKERLERNAALLDAFEEAKAPYDLTKEAIAALDDAAFQERFKGLITGFYFEVETSYFTTIYNTSNSKLDFKVTFEKARKACGGDLDYLALVSGLEDLSHLRPMADLFALCSRLKAEGRGPTDAEVRAFAALWPYKSRRELDIRVPRWRDDPEHLRQVIEQSLAAFDPKHDPGILAEKQREAYEKEREKAVKAMRFKPLLRPAFEEGLDLVRSYAWWREEMRDRSTFTYHLIRDWTLDAARRLAARGVLEDPDDVWYLRHQQVIEAIEGALEPEDARERVRAGRRMVRSFRRFKNPNELGRRFKLAPSESKAKGRRSLKGIPCSAGVLEGVAKVCRSLDEAQKVEQGDILVTVFTDPGWTPLLGLVGGVVTETGGLLSHAAVISREYGIPAVLAVTGATEAIQDGDTLRIDGSHGEVVIVSRAGE